MHGKREISNEKNFTRCAISAIPNIVIKSIQTRKGVEFHGDEEGSSEEARKKGRQEEVGAPTEEATATSPPPFPCSKSYFRLAVL